MKNKLPTVTVAMSAYNEEANISKLLATILAQKEQGFTTKKVIVMDDCSDDKTVAEAKRIKGNKIKIVHGSERKGKAFRLNQLKNFVDTDILVILDADTAIKSKLFIRSLIKPIVEGKADLTSGRIEELPPENFIESILDTSMKIKKNMFESHNKGNNIYTCHGRSRAFSKKLYKKMNFEVPYGEDAYSYLFCIKNNFKYSYSKDARIYYRLPNNLYDHQKQSIRFMRSQILLGEKFGNTFVLKSYKIPKNLVRMSLVKYLVRNPLLVVSYFIIHLYMQLKFTFVKVDAAWDVSSSTKRKLFSIIFLNYEV